MAAERGVGLGEIADHTGVLVQRSRRALQMRHRRFNLTELEEGRTQEIGCVGVIRGQRQRLLVGFPGRFEATRPVLAQPRFEEGSQKVWAGAHVEL